MAHRIRALTPLLLGTLLAGCGGDETEAPPPGNAASDCEAPEVALPDGTCIRPGVPPEGCAEGFIHDGEYGCEPILPAEPCPPGLMAVPGETECRAIMECGEGTWGDLPVDGTTQHVDGAYAGGNSNGSAAAPWTTIGEAVDAAAAGALVAVAAGSYVEDVLIYLKPVRLWGRCPELVEIVGTGAENGAVVIAALGSGTEVGGLALRGNNDGLAVGGVEDIRFDRVWVHQTASRGINVQDSNDPAGARITDSLVEEAHEIGIAVLGSEAVIERTVVRNTQPRSGVEDLGHGIHVQLSCMDDLCNPSTRSNVTVRGSLIEGSREVGFHVSGSDAVLEGSVVRDTWPSGANPTISRGVALRACLPEGGCDPPARSNTVVRDSLIERSHEGGFVLTGSDALVERTVVRRTQRSADSVVDGFGIYLQIPVTLDDWYPATRANFTLRHSLVEQSHAGGLLATGSDALVEDTVVRATLPDPVDETLGRGVSIQVWCGLAGCDMATRSTGTIRRSLVEQSHDIGLLVATSDGVVEGTVVRSTLARVADGFFGDGISVFSDGGPASVAITNTLVADSARAGIASFGGATSLGTTHVRCAGYELEGEPFGSYTSSFEDLGGNYCGCPEAKGACVVESAGLAPPEPTGPAQ